MQRLEEIEGREKTQTRLHTIYFTCMGEVFLNVCLFSLHTLEDVWNSEGLGLLSCALPLAFKDLSLR